MSTPLGIFATGMVTGVGFTASASCAAIRCGLNNFDETRFRDRQGAWIIASQVPLEPPWRGLTKLAKMAASAIRESFEQISNLVKPGLQIPLVLCLAEDSRPGRLAGLGAPLLFDIERELALKFHPDSSVLELGRVGGAVALLRAQKLIQERGHPYVLIAGVDTYLTAATVAAFDERNRLLTPENSNGFVPGEAAAALLVGRAAEPESAPLMCRALGFSREEVTIESEKPLRADGMVEAMRTVLATAGIGLENVDFRISDVSGEQYRFKEVVLATTRIRRDHRLNFDIWHPADCIGEVGAAALPVMLGVIYFGARKGYLPGSTALVHLSNDDDKRAALIVSAHGSA